jgi:hypothetical protein
MLPAGGQQFNERRDAVFTVASGGDDLACVHWRRCRLYTLLLTAIAKER